ncbi:MAG: hypothetical protein RLZZ458_987 [Planctomycetota bacterium]
MSPLQNDEFGESVQDGPAGHRRLCLLKGCECPFRASASTAEVLFSGMSG